MPNLYFTNTSGDYNWETLENWNTAADGSGSIATNIPWADDGNGGAWYSNYDLLVGDGVSYDYINIAQATILGNGITGTCSLHHVSCFGVINSGTWTGDYVYASCAGGWGHGTINGGTFTGNYCGTDPDSVGDGAGRVNGGTFTGDYFNNSGVIYGGIFHSAYMTNGGGSMYQNSGFIYGGTFTGDYFTNSDSVAHQGIILAGTFTGSHFTNPSGAVITGGTLEINAFNNSGYIKYSGITIKSNGVLYTGAWDGNSWVNGLFTSANPLYFTNASGDWYWETLANWNTAADGSGDNPSNIPWTQVNSGEQIPVEGASWYGDSELLDATTSSDFKTISHTTIISGDVTGTCRISNIGCFGTINGGTWTGDYVFASSVAGIGRGQIYGGNFYGSPCGTDPDNGTGTGGGLVDGGDWHGSYFNAGVTYGGNFYGANSQNCGNIYGGDFLGSNFQNWASPPDLGGYISGGSFHNVGFSNGNRSDLGGVFSAFFDGSNFDNSYGKVYQAYISGTFNNGSFDTSLTNFTSSGQIGETYFDGPAVETGTYNGKNFSFMDDLAGFEYPASSGGRNSMISRLLNLPWFINI